MFSTDSGTCLRITCSLLTLSVICFLILFIFIDSGPGIYSKSQANNLAELEFPLLFFRSKLFFLLQSVASMWLVTPAEEGPPCMACVLIHSEVNRPGAIGFSMMFVYKRLV